MGVPDVVTDIFWPIYDNESEVRQILFVADIFHLEQRQLARGGYVWPIYHFFRWNVVLSIIYTLLPCELW